MKTTDPDGTVPSGDDAQLLFVYQEAVRGLTHQQGVVENLNTRAGNLIFATAFATSLLGTRALSDGLGFWDWAAMVLLFLVGGLIVFMLWPYYNYTFRFDPEELLTRYVDRDRPATMAEMHRALALRIKEDMANNWRIIGPIRVALQLALVLLLLEILAWLLSIAGTRMITRSDGTAAHRPKSPSILALVNDHRRLRRSTAQRASVVCGFAPECHLARRIR